MRLAPVLARLSAVFLAATASPVALTAQAPTTFSAPRQSVACPVAFQAERRSLPAFNQAGFALHPPTRQSIQLTFTPPADRKIFGVSLTIHGTAHGDRTVPAGLASQPTDDVQATLTLMRSYGEESLTRATVPRPAGIQVVQWVELSRITFTDGSAWNASATSQCRATPELLQLVAEPR